MATKFVVQLPPPTLKTPEPLAQLPDVVSLTETKTWPIPTPASEAVPVIEPVQPLAEYEEPSLGKVIVAVGALVSKLNWRVVALVLLVPVGVALSAVVTTIV